MPARGRMLTIRAVAPVAASAFAPVAASVFAASDGSGSAADSTWRTIVGLGGADGAGAAG